MAYAVQNGGPGVIFDDFQAARDMYHRLQGQGVSPSLWTGPSLTDAVCFVENFSPKGRSLEAERRRGWIEEEYQARRLLLAENWGAEVHRGQDDWSSESDVSDPDSSAGSTEVGE